MTSQQGTGGENSIPHVLSCLEGEMDKLFLLRYDTERKSSEEMAGFFEQVVAVHRADDIPATFFCTGGAIEARESDFRAFYEAVKEDALFDIQDHSYSHIGLGYEAGKPVEVLKADYDRSFAVHERVFGKRPIGLSVCGTSGADGQRLSGFDQTEKSQTEFAMVADLGVRMINATLTGKRESHDFINYGSLGYPDIMGFPSAYSDTSWMYRKTHGDPLDFVLSVIDERADQNAQLPLMLHDWVAWNHASDQALTHVRQIVDYARKKGYTAVSHAWCLKETSLWK